MTREYSNKLLEMVDDGLISYEAIAKAALVYMPESEVKDMAICEQLIAEDD
jgi:hypothetical protein